jgi:hypothetical protein
VHGHRIKEDKQEVPQFLAKLGFCHRSVPRHGEIATATISCAHRCATHGELLGIFAIGSGSCGYLSRVGWDLEWWMIAHRNPRGITGRAMPLPDFPSSTPPVSFPSSDLPRILGPIASFGLSFGAWGISCKSGEVRHRGGQQHRLKPSGSRGMAPGRRPINGGLGLEHPIPFRLIKLESLRSKWMDTIWLRREQLPAMDRSASSVHLFNR